MKRFISKIYARFSRFLILAALLLQGCDSESIFSDVDNAEGKAGYISISLRSSKANSRATEDDIDNLNENLIESAILCFYPENNPSDKPVLVEYVNDIDQKTRATVEVSLESSIKDVLFPLDANTCRVYVIANPPVGMQTVTTDMTLAEIKKLPISANFASSGLQPSFTMDGTDPAVTIHDRGTTSEGAKGGVLLQRCASKITLAVNVDSSIEVENPSAEGGKDIWTPQYDNITALITNGVNKSEITSMSYTPTEDDYYSTSNSDDIVDHRQRKLELDAISTEYPYVLSSPFYTFPTKWDSTDPTSHQLYMTLMVPWRLNNEERYRTSYYTVPVIAGSEIGRNVSYRVNIHVSMLGSFTPDEPFELSDLSYYAVDWGREGIDVELADTRYLVVDQTAYTMNNQQSITIPVYTSHETEVTSSTMTYYRYYTTNQGFETPITIGSTQYNNTVNNNQGKIYDYDFHNATSADPSNYLYFDHEMVTWTPRQTGGAEVTFPKNNTNAATEAINGISYYTKTDEAAYSRYVTTIKIAHRNHPEFNQTITITQYPQMYITSTQNAYVVGSNMSAQQGNLWVNGHQGTAFRDNDSQSWYGKRPTRLTSILSVRFFGHFKFLHPLKKLIEG